MDHLSVNRNSPSPTSSLESMGSSNSLTGVYVYRSRSFNFRRKKKHHSSSVTLPHQSNEIDFEEPPYLTSHIKSTRPRCNTDPSKFKNPRSGVLDKLVKHTIHMKSSPIAIAVRSPSPVTENIQNQYSFDFEDESSIG
ncbi:uncharacterized protein LOC129607761 isoform X2 [Condylostylus longicornis]|uniref:uncharacterized protein LOC129607761 isoform X2 n=1 Tax=Condylostylus longicornis TaxID=2530218 RepID=UPI00244E16D6|nr:uncharacterized protein LOC129607761 isoform X2 [Condylostylus longicornis]